MRHRERDYKDWYSMTGSDETTTETTSWSWWDYSRQNKRNLSCNRCREKVRRNKREQEQELGGAGGGLFITAENEVHADRDCLPFYGSTSSSAPSPHSSKFGDFSKG